MHSDPDKKIVGLDNFIQVVLKTLCINKRPLIKDL